MMPPTTKKSTAREEKYQMWFTRYRKTFQMTRSIKCLLWSFDVCVFAAEANEQSETLKRRIKHFVHNPRRGRRGEAKYNLSWQEMKSFKNECPVQVPILQPLLLTTNNWSQFVEPSEDTLILPSLHFDFRPKKNLYELLKAGTQDRTPNSI